MQLGDSTPEARTTLDRVAPFVAGGSTVLLALVVGVGTWQWMVSNARLEDAQATLAMRRSSLVTLERERLVEAESHRRATADRTEAANKAAGAARELESRRAREQERDAQATDPKAQAEAAAVMRVTVGMLRAAEEAAASGDPASVKVFEDALQEASRLLNYQESARGGSLQPELDAVVGEMLARRGWHAAARDHFGRAASTGRGLLPDQRIFECWIAAGESAVIAGDRPGVAAIIKEAEGSGTERSPAQALRLARLRALASRDSGSPQQRRSDLRAWMSAAESGAGGAPQQLHEAALALAADLRAQRELEEAETILRAQLERDQRRPAPTLDLIETRALLARTLLDRGRSAEGTPLLGDVLAALRAIDPSEHAMVADSVIDLLLARQEWEPAAQLLTARWKASAGAAVGPAERVRLATRLMDLYERAGKPELAAQWKSTLDQLRASGPPSGGRRDAK